MAVVDDAAIARDFTKGRLQGDPIGVKVSCKGGPPRRFSVDDFGEFRFRNAVLKTCLNQDLAVDGSVAQSLSDRDSYLVATTRRALIDRDDLHGRNLLMKNLPGLEQFQPFDPRQVER